jgi:DNA-binding CsgD family transcriptional regulator
VAVDDEMLLEREAELALLERSLGQVVRGRGRRIVIEGPAGIGKSALVALACRRARQLGMVVLGAAAPELGSRVALGVARELLGDAATAPAAVDGAPGGDPRAVAARLAQAVIELAGEAPMLIAVDDLQWADPGTQRWLVELARHLSATPLALMLAVRSGAAGEGGAALDALLDDRDALVLRPAPLSAEATAELLAARLGRVPETELVAAACRETAGNPYLVRTLGAALRQSGGAGGLDAASWVREVGSRAVARHVTARLRGLDPVARAVAEAAAVVGDVGGLEDLAAIAGIDPAAAADAAGRLAAEDLLQAADSIELSHPLVASTIRAALPAERREELLRSAGRHLAAVGRIEDAAARLLGLPARADPAVAATLAEAAALAAGRGAPEVAVALLRRALAEPPGPGQTPTIRARLGEALLAVADPDAAAVLEAALAEARGSTARAGAARALALALVFTMRIPDAVELLDRVAAETRAADPATAEELEAQMLHYASLDSRLRERRVARLRAIGAERGASELAYRLRLAGLASESLGACEPAAATAALAERALAGGTLLSSAPAVHLSVTVFLAQVGRVGVARAQLQDAIATARERGQTALLSFALGVHGEVLWRQGDLVAAETDLRAALELVDYRELAVPFILRPLLETLLELGETATAEAELRRAGLVGDLAEVVSRAAILHARGRVRAAAGAPRLALEDLRLAGDSLRRFGVDTPAAVPWRGAAASILIGLGEREEAIALSAAEVGLAERIGAPEVLGPALRLHAAALGDGGRETLERAVALLAGSSDRLAHAHALVDLGARSRQAGEAPRARELLRDGGALAEESGATLLAQRAIVELARAGGRPRRQAARGARALTPAERRVASLAAQGLTNAQIAETLVLARKTIETHLTTTYRKLGVHARAELAAALAPVEPPASGQISG